MLVLNQVRKLRVVVYVVVKIKKNLYCITVPAAPTSCNITLMYDQPSGNLQFINGTWVLMPVSHMTGYPLTQTVGR